MKIQTGRSLSKVIENIMKESIKSTLHNNAMEEKDRQRAMLGEEDDDLLDSSEEKNNKSEKATSSKSVDAEKEKLKKGNIKAKDIVDKLNSIRSGRSFKDSSVAGKLEEYVESLSNPERVALLAFLKGLAQIVTGEIEPEQAQDPSDDPADVDMEKRNEPHKKSIKPNVIKAPEKEKTEKKASSEDTSGPVPITPKKK